MKLLVTGGAGFIGANFVRYWLEHHPDDIIVNLDALTYAGNLDNLAGLDPARHIFIKGDIRDAGAVHQAMEGVDAVVHFAAESHVDNSINRPRDFLDTNVMGTFTLLEEVRKRAGQIKRFHHVSTDEVYGALALDEPRRFDESSCYAPRSPYSASKAASDHLVSAYHHTYGLPTTVSHCSNNYGPYQHAEKFIPLLITNALRDKPLPIYGDGLYVRDWIHTEDHCRGIEAILERGRVGESYCLGGNAERTNLDVAKEILHLLEKPTSLLTSVPDRPGHDRRYAIDSSKARRELDWQAKKTFEDGLRETVEWYKKNIH